MPRIPQSFGFDQRLVEQPYFVNEPLNTMVV